ncbi:hypothetical protein DINM_005351 [Dirofilaria immitis]|nr:hypothetical protein [Dirofilaria immitis]
MSVMLPRIITIIRSCHFYLVMRGYLVAIIIAALSNLTNNHCLISQPFPSSDRPKSSSGNISNSDCTPPYIHRSILSDAVGTSFTGFCSSRASFLHLNVMFIFGL